MSIFNRKKGEPQDEDEDEDNSLFTGIPGPLQSMLTGKIRKIFLKKNKRSVVMSFDEKADTSEDAAAAFSAKFYDIDVNTWMNETAAELDEKDKEIEALKKQIHDTAKRVGFLERFHTAVMKEQAEAKTAKAQTTNG